jgi:phosphoribosyl 1,2-cyclic phosphodiesterase
VQVQFWGTRGSIPKPGATTIHYGGNTLCHEIRTARGTLVIIDCGTGLHGLGLKLLSGGGRNSDQSYALGPHPGRAVLCAIFCTWKQVGYLRP